jgi:hypothetical protein|tara:strand:+ start:583 stop:744 length:162 start_codon:yes stop_codon:yes gene_type:complete
LKFKKGDNSSIIKVFDESLQNFEILCVLPFDVLFIFMPRAKQWFGLEGQKNEV